MHSFLCHADSVGPNCVLHLSEVLSVFFYYFLTISNMCFSTFHQHLLKCPSFHPVLGPFLFRGFHILPHTSFWERTLCSYASKVLVTLYKSMQLGTRHLSHPLTFSSTVLSERDSGWRFTAEAGWGRPELLHTLKCGFMSRRWQENTWHCCGTLWHKFVQLSPLR